MKKQDLINMIKEEIEKDPFIEKYGRIPLNFSSYYKFSFSFKGRASDGIEIYASMGGQADDIYRYEVSADTTEKIGDGSDWNHISFRKNGKKIHEWDNPSW